MIEYSFNNSKNSVVTQTTEWIIDTEMPILKGEGREYVDKLINVGEGV